MHIKRILWLILLVLIKSSASAQDTVMVISPALYEDVEEIYPAKMHGWYFKQGSDTAWAAKELDMKGWKKMRPVDLSVDLADANGKVEGWFRGTIKIDSSFGNTTLSLLFGVWAAQDLYIDGKKIASAGNTGSNGLPYEENIKFDRQGLALPELKAGTTHTIAWHITDSRGIPFNSNKLKGSERGLHNLLEFASPRFFTWQFERKQFIWQIQAAIIACELMFVLLFWLLWGLNREQKNILYFALFTSFLAIYFMSGNLNSSLFFSLRFSYTISQWLNFIRNMLICPIMGFSSYILSQIFNHKLGKKIPALILICTILNLINFIYLQQRLLVAALIIFCLLISIYIIATSIKKAKGADWAVIAGIFLTIVFSLLGYAVTSGIYNYKIAQLIIIGFYLSFPLSLLVYVAIRFRQIIGEVRYNAEQVIKLSEEKRIQAEQQQEILEVQVRERTLELEDKNSELEVEAAMERVRSRTMGMQKSDELAETVSILFKQLLGLGIPYEQLRTCGIATFHENEPKGDVFMSDIDGEIISDSFEFRYDEAPSYKAMFDAWKRGEKHVVLHLSDQALIEHFGYIKKYSGVTNFNLEDVGKTFTEIYFHAMFFSQGYLFVIAYKPLVEFHEIFKRFGTLFQQTYTRFLDFKKSEAQAREAQIEAALERVRSRSMAMRKSEELADLSFELVKQVHSLGVPTWFCAFNITNNIANNSLEWGSNSEGTYDKYITPRENIFLRYYEAGQRGEVLHINEIGPDACVQHYQYLCSLPGLGEQLQKMKEAGIAFPKSQIDHVAYFKYGYILFITFEPALASHDIFKRFAKVFEQTYIRFLDLQKAEAQAKESQIEAALERVRSRTLAMQKSDELAETAAEVFRQLIALGIEPNRLYIGIIKGEEGDMEMWATDEDGTEVSKKFVFNKNENSSVNKLYSGWETKQRSVIVNMEGKELDDYFHYLNHVMHIPFKDGLTQKRRVQSVAYFSKGFIGMASPDGQGDETIQLLERFAAVFNLTFTRFNDLKIAEAHAEQAELDLIKLKEEKKRTEEALNELQLTQKQLIQSEKMASLGELTAGIAHEIQNPLNFVNNFSEVSTELVDEMNEEMEKGNLEDAKEIAADLKQNLEKINHHGKRAGDIVKGMLQHSRSSSGQKEPTDINALCDEYLRLAYHGLRAKDKEFNATLVTDLDPSIGKVNIIPQDLGRVVLNLITNAFYAVSEKKIQSGNTYEPTVTVSTQLSNTSINPLIHQSANSLIISVKDNGSGIPAKILDKIFQPFFTTKPTGQGTGLGLSLSYDIVKAHSGELKVETKENEGTEFIIILPIR